MSAGKVTVIIPVYNVDKYLRQCLESVCNQTYKDLEIIVVDDESSDLSGNIADDFAIADKRVKVMHIKNRGAAGARNVALDEVTGQYIMFVDSDDWLELNAVERMINVMSAEKCQIVQCQYADEFVNQSKNHTYIEKNDICNPKDFVEGMLSKWEYIVIWNKLFESQLVEDIRFVEGRCIDDEFFTYKVILKANKIAMIEDYLYHYRQRKSSAMGSADKKKQRLTDQVDFVTQRYTVLRYAFPDLSAKLLTHMTEVLMHVMQNSAEYKEIYTYAKKHLKKSLLDLLFNFKVDVHLKIDRILYMIRKIKFFLDKQKNIPDNQKYFFE